MIRTVTRRITGSRDITTSDDVTITKRQLLHYSVPRGAVLSDSVANTLRGQFPVSVLLTGLYDFLRGRSYW